MKQSGIDYILAVIASVWNAFVSAPLVIKITTFICTGLFSLFTDLYVFLFGVIILAGLDAHCAIKACIITGGKYESHKIKKGLLQKFKLYFTLFILTIVLDSAFHEIYNYGRYYFTALVFAFILLYEAGSIVESLNVTHPNNKMVAKVSKILNLTERTLNDKLD